MTTDQQSRHDELMTQADNALRDQDRHVAHVTYNEMDDFYGEMTDEQNDRFDDMMARLSRFAHA